MKQKEFFSIFTNNMNSAKENIDTKEENSLSDSDIVIDQDGKITSGSYKKWYETNYKKIMDQPYVDPKSNNIIMK